MESTGKTGVRMLSGRGPVSASPDDAGLTRSIARPCTERERETERIRRPSFLVYIALEPPPIVNAHQISRRVRKLKVVEKAY
jgi:hypothetical protein